MISVPPPVLESLARKYEINAAQMRHFGGGREDSDGVVYAYPCDGRQRLLKILAVPLEDRQRGLFCLDEWLRFVRYLGENGANIVYPLLSPQASLYETHLGEAHLWVAYSMEVAPGKVRSEADWDPEFFRNWGQTVGMLHRLARGYPSWMSSQEPESGKEYLTWSEEWQGFYEWCQDPEARQKWVEIGDQLRGLPVERDSFGFIHNDPHLWNLLADGSRITLLDFDVANHHWFLTDIAIACQSILFAHTGGMDRPVSDRPRLHQFLAHFLEGYRRENRQPSGWLERIDLFIAYRRILLFTVMQGWIQSKPDWLRSWKEMILSQPVVVGTFSDDV